MEKADYGRNFGDYRVIGKGKPIHDAAWKVTGRKQYVADMKLPGMLYGKILFSEVAHAHIREIDVSEAEALPGVWAVISYKNTPQNTYNSAKRYIEQSVICNEKIFDDTVRFVGDRVAAVAAETEAIAAEALKRIRIVYEPLPVITTIEEAIAEGAYPIHEGGNVIARMHAGKEDLSEEFAACDYVIEGKYTTPAIHHAAIEPHAAIADWGYDDKLIVYSPNQNSFAFRIILSDIFQLPYNKIRVISPAIGGAFGGKLEMTIEPVAAMLSRQCGRPVKIVLTRKETITSSRVRHASLHYIKTGFDREGRIRAMDFKIYTNTGAYASSALNVAGALMHKVFMAYQVKAMHIEAIPVYTNTLIGGAMRGYGSPQVYFGMQRQINEVARFLKKDAADIQRLNMIDPDSLHPLSGQPIGNPRPKDCLERALELMDYEQALKEQRETHQDRYAIGVGIALGVHGNNCYGVHRDNSSPMLKMNEDGSCILYTGSHDMGTDTVGMQMQIVSEMIGIRMEHIYPIAGDTDVCLWHIGDYSSRGVFVVGAAAKKSAAALKRELTVEAAKYLNAPEESISFGEEQVWSEEAPENKISLRELMIFCQSTSHREICVYETYEATRGASSYGVHIAKVQVDRETGKTRVLRYVAVHDVGFVLNPLVLTGQLQGGLHMGIGYGLSEEITYDEKGRPTPLTLKKYGVLRANEMPDEILVDFIADKGGEPEGPFGAKALGECPVVPTAPALVNAICNALDITINDLPAKPERVRRAQEEKKGAEG